MKAVLIGVRTSSNLDYIAMVCQNCNRIGMLTEAHTEYFCSWKCQKKFNTLRVNPKEGTNVQ